MNPNDILVSADTANMQAGGKSWTDSVGDFFQYGASAAVASGAASIYNTGVQAVKYFGADAEEWNVAQSLTNVDENWGKYYQEHKGAIDAVGFVGTSFIPGGLAVKGLNMARRGKAFGAFGEALNFTATKQASALNESLRVLASPEGSVFKVMNANFIKSVAWGTADNAVQAFAFETAVMATMHASPLLEGQSAKDMAHDVLINTLVGGGIGGAIEGFIAKGISKSAVKQVDAAGRKYEPLLTKAEQGLNVSVADKAYSYIDALQALPKEVFQEDKALGFAYKLNGTTHNLNLQTGELFDKTLQKSVTKAYTEFESLITNNLTTDLTVGKAMSKALLDLVKEGRAANLADDAINARAGDLLFNLVGTEGVGNRLGDLTDTSIRYVNKRGPAPADITSGFKNLMSTAQLEGWERMRLVGKAEDLKISLIGKDHLLTKDAWADGMDLAFRPDGTWMVNPASKVLRPAPESATLQTFFNTELKQTLDKATLTVADIATKEAPLIVDAAGTIKSGDKLFKNSLDTPLGSKADSIEQSARHLWASKLEKVDGTIDSYDFSVLDKMAASKKIVADETLINVAGQERNWRDLGNFDNWVLQNKVEYLRTLYSTNKDLDIQKVAMEINATPTWVQDVIGSRFDLNISKLAEGAPDLSVGHTRALESYATRENLILNYKRPAGIITDDFGNLVEGSPKVPFMDSYGAQIMVDARQPFITGELSYNYRKAMAKEQLELAARQAIGDGADVFYTWDAEGLSTLSDRLGSGATALGSSNANYGDRLRLMSQETGKQVHLLAASRSDNVMAQLQPHLAELKNSPKEAAELTAVVTKLRRSSQKYAFLDAEYGLDGAYIVDQRMLRGSTPEQIAMIREAAKTGAVEGMEAFKIESTLVSDFLKLHQKITVDTAERRAVLMRAQGMPMTTSATNLYVPPIDTRKVPFFAFVRETEGKIFGTSNVSMITARSADELLTHANNLPEGFQVIFKKDSEAFFKAKGDYDYNRALNDSAVHTNLKKEGKLGDFMPSFRPEDIIEDFLQFHNRQQTQLVRDAVSTKYAQTFVELTRLSEQYTAAATSKLGVVDKFLKRSVNDPYDDYIKTALDISKRSEFTLLHQTNEFIDAVGTRAYAAIDKARGNAFKGELTYEEANQQMVKYGLPGPYADAHAFNTAQTVGDRNLIKTAIQKSNLILANFTLRFDMANSLLNIISTPIMLGTELSSIKNSIRSDPQLVGALQELTTLKVPGQSAAIPSTTKLVFNAMKNYWGEGSKELLERYKANGDIGTVLSMHRQMTDDLAIANKLIPSEFSAKADKWTERVASGMGNNFAEQFTRFVSADVMRQLSDPIVKAGKMSLGEQNAFISVFVNRVQGNYISSQRPILFQGTLGSALGLFQTYQFNMLQQLFRHVENRDLRSAAVMGGLQTSVFGLNGLPMFEAINTNIIGNANMNPGHKDVYTTVTEAVGKDMGDWLLYGTASAFPLFSGNAPSLYTRGDVNPRHPTVIPVNPLDVPAVDGSLRFVKNLIDMGKKLGAGGEVGATLLTGLEHNSISRPLAGVAQVMQGFSTTGKGSLISANNDLLSLASASRVFGSKPMDESVGLNTKFRLEAYKAEDKSRIETLGKVVKDRLRGQQAPTEDEYTQFASQYAKAGGNAATFSSTLQGWAKDANVSVLNTMSAHAKSSYGQRFNEIMGGTRLPDRQIVPNPSQDTE